MSEHDESRRAFIVGAVGAGAAASTALVQAAYAKTARPKTATAKIPTSKSPTAAGAPAEHAVEIFEGGHGVFFNDEHAATVAAFAERLMPGAPGKPGATDANVINYIDLALAGAYADQQDFYRRGLAQLDAYCRKAYDQPFVKLSAAQQDDVISALEQGKASEFEFPTAQAFFNTLRAHTMEGMFADPVYGGNKDFAGWKLVGFPGVQLFYTGADLASKEAFTRAPITGLQGRATKGA
ncbi:MAG TPA: gluconate 2-dehydrogenase subunit 3 family protein [Xanthobacteraceae bacterium]|jgi:gluconate 2-dehydrogenase gamma chain|nr:gluconate 2-dehydrogenase subunit 3 family protein [Xanthobacteraceae bacterium]